MQYVELIIITALLQFVFFAAMTGKARVKYGIKAPAISGHEGFERIYRVQMNTLEMLIIFIPAIFIASSYWPTSMVSSLGIVYLTGRFIYWRAYTQDPKSRSVGFMLSILPSLLLIILAIVGIIMSLLSSNV